MLYLSNRIFYRFFFFFFNVFKKKKLGTKKIQWKLFSFLHSNRMKYFYYFINKLFLYKKYFYYFYLRLNIYYFFTHIKIYMFSLLIPKEKLINNRFFCSMLDKSLFILDEKVSIKNSVNNINLFYFLLVTNLQIKIIFFMSKNLSFSHYFSNMKKNKITLLRSPHIDKKSREQFEMRHFSTVINDSSIFSIFNNVVLSNCFSFFIRNFKLNEKLELINK